MKKHLLLIALPWVLTACGGGGGSSNNGGAPGPVYAASNPGECPSIEGTYREGGPEVRGRGRERFADHRAVLNVRRDAAGFLIIKSDERNIRLHTDGQTRGGNEGQSFSICSRGRVSGQTTGRHSERRDYLIVPAQGGLSVTITDALGTPTQLFFGKL